MSDLPIFPNKKSPDAYCLACNLWKECRHPRMDGEGSESPAFLFVGEGPGATEDDEGYPFCGEAGSELRQAIENVGIPIKKCRFTNVVRCRPPDNDLSRWPKAIEYCRPHILREMRSTQPKVVVLLGNSATKSILNRTGILRLHGEIIDVEWTKFVCVFHPAYLLRNDTPDIRKKFYDALKIVKRAASSDIVKTKEKRNHTIVTDRKMLQEHVDFLKREKYVATDIEGSTLSPFATYRKPEIGVIGFAWTKKDAVAFPLFSRIGLKCKIHPEEVLEGVKEVWEDPNIRFLTWNGKYDMGYTIVLHDIWLGGKGHKTGSYMDGMLGSYALDERKGIHGLKDWAFKVGMGGYEQKLRQYCFLYPEADPDRGGSFSAVPAEILYPYNMDDCICTYRSCFKQKPQLIEQKLWERPLKFPLMYISWVAMMMEIVGINVDKKRNLELGDVFKKRIEKLDKRLYSYPVVRQLQEQADLELLEELHNRVETYKRPVPDVKKKVLELFKQEQVNLDSPDVKRKLLFDILDYEPLAETKKSHQPSVERWVLEELQAKHKSPVLRDIIDRSTYSSANSKYIEPIPGWIGADGRVHSSFLPHGTSTGRMASRNPNLYNLPARSKLTDELMTQFSARKEGYFVVKQDSKQIELRLIADRAQDEVMIQEFNDSKDPHAMGAQAAYELTEEQWARLPNGEQKEKRGICKNAVSFGLIYGRDAPALAADFGWPARKAERFKERYFSKYHGIWQYLQDQREYIIEHQEVISHFGRHRRLPDAQNEDMGRQNAAVREGINAPIQGDASDICLIAAYRMARWLQKYDMKTRVILYVYDAVYLDAYHKEMQDVNLQLHLFMIDRDYYKKMTGWRLGVPLDTDAFVGPNLGSTKELVKENGQFVILSEFC